MTTISNDIPSSPTGLYVDNITSTSYSLHWDTPKDYVYGSQFIVYSAGKELFPLPKNAAPSVNLVNQKPATTFTIHVTQKNPAGVESSPSNTITFKTLA